MYAVIKTGGKQYRVAAQDVLTVEKISGEAGDIVEFNEVLLVAGENDVSVGAPLVSGASVAGEVVEQGRAKKIIVFKKKRRKGYRRTNGHRQLQTTIRITEILTDGQKPAAAKAKKAQTDTASTAKTPPKTSSLKAKTAPVKVPSKTVKKPAAKKPPAKKPDDNQSID